MGLSCCQPVFVDVRVAGAYQGRCVTAEGITEAGVSREETDGMQQSSCPLCSRQEEEEIETAEGIGG